MAVSPSPTPVSEQASAEFEKTFTKRQKMALGKRCKRLLDLGRAHWLQQVFFDQISACFNGEVSTI